MNRIKNDYEQTVSDYVGYKSAEGLKPSYTNDLRGRLFYVGRQCGFVTVKEITKERLLEWFLGLPEIDASTGKASRSPASRSLYRKAVYPFLEWCIMMSRFEGENPADKLPRARAKGDIRRRRRALSEAELLRTLPICLWRKSSMSCPRSGGGRSRKRHKRCQSLLEWNLPSRKQRSDC